MARSERANNLTTTEHALLGMLARYGECSGYELLRQAHEGIGFFWSPAKSHVYDVLPRLEQGGFAHRRVVAQDGRPDKHLWRLTRRGRAALGRWIALPEPDPFSNLSVLLLKLFFGDYGNPLALVALVERYCDQARRQLNTLRAVDAEAVFVAPEELPRMTLRFGLAEVEAQLNWAEAILPELRARLAPSHRAFPRPDQPTTHWEC
jgi:DNA-binding PadR family transcriptional regulator